MVNQHHLSQAAETETFIKESEARIAKLQAELVEWEKMIPYDQMTMEEMVEAFPEHVSSSTIKFVAIGKLVGALN